MSARRSGGGALEVAWVAIAIASAVVGSSVAQADDDQPTLADVCQQLTEQGSDGSVGVGVYRLDEAGERQPVVGCLGAGTGAWAIVVEAVATPEDSEMGPAARWSVHHVASDGSLTTFVPPPPRDYEWVGLPEGANLGDTAPEIEVRAVADIDAYGEEELALAVIHSVVEDIGAVYVLRFDDGEVAPMPLTWSGRLRDVTDVDADGRVDLIFEGAYWVPWSCGDAGPDAASGFPVVAHSLTDGSFSLTDEVARAGAQETCSSVEPSGALVAPSDWGAPFDPHTTVTRIACARYRDVPADQVTAQLREELAALTATSPASEWECLPSAEALLALPRAEPPFVLGP